MSIIGIIFLSLLLGIMGFLIALVVMAVFVSGGYLYTRHFAIAIVVGVAVLVASVFIGIGLVTESAETWVASYEAQKATIEASVESENLSGLEKFELVKKATELNGEMAERKAKADRWYWVYYGGNPYADCELIRL